MVTVVDAVNFMKDYEAAISLQEAGESLGPEDQRSVADLLVDQAEFADVILISKTDLVSDADVERLKAILSTLNTCLLYTSPSPRDATLSRMPSSA